MTLLDVREQIEWDAGHIPGAAFIPQGQLPDRIEAEFPDKDQPIVLYCRSGARSGRATQLLQRLGYTDVVNMAGGTLRADQHGWDRVAPSLTRQQSRYSRTCHP